MASAMGAPAAMRAFERVGGQGAVFGGVGTRSQNPGFSPGWRCVSEVSEVSEDGEKNKNHQTSLGKINHKYKRF